MDLQRFLDWFAGYSENIKEAPDKEQWARIRERLSEIDPNSAGSTEKPSRPVPIPAEMPQPVAQPKAPAKPSKAKENSFRNAVAHELLTLNLSQAAMDSCIAQVDPACGEEPAVLARRLAQEVAAG